MRLVHSKVLPRRDPHGMDGYQWGLERHPEDTNLETSTLVGPWMALASSKILPILMILPTYLGKYTRDHGIGSI